MRRRFRRIVTPRSFSLTKLILYLAAKPDDRHLGPGEDKSRSGSQRRHMANEKHVALLKQGVDVWNKWRKANPDIMPDLRGANLSGAVLYDANLPRAILNETVFGDTNLTEAKGLETCQHHGPSIIDHQTLQRSGPLPLAFLRGVGLPERLIDYLPSILEQAIQFYSCFISYSSKDQKFADRLHADLQNKGVRCWFAPHDLPIGAKTWDTIDEAIRLRDKVLLILSKGAIESDWVEDEVTKAFAEERTRQQLVLFPVRLDDAVMKTMEPWAGKLRDNRNIGDFRRWKEHDAYQKALERLLRDLRVAKA